MHRALLFLSLAVAACGKGTASTQPAPPCPSTFKDLKGATGETACACAATSPRGSVWGVDVYTQDSSLCAAAMHAGAIPAAGGEIKVKASAGCSTYQGAARNGITSGSWGNYPGSFYFVGKGDGRCGAVAAAAAPPAQPVGDCPRTFQSIPGVGPTTELTCECKPVQGGSSVWGSSIYTQDSSICGAAVHAGVIASTGGVLAVKAAPGCRTYIGTAQNGITTGSWGSFAGSFFFPVKGAAECAKG
jgi:hypothetical protein